MNYSLCDTDLSAFIPTFQTEQFHRFLFIIFSFKHPFHLRKMCRKERKKRSLYSLFAAGIEAPFLSDRHLNDSINCRLYLRFQIEIRL